MPVPDSLIPVFVFFFYKKLSCRREAARCFVLSMLDNWTEALETGGQIDTIYTIEVINRFTLTTRKLLTRFLIKDL